MTDNRELTKLEIVDGGIAQLLRWVWSVESKCGKDDERLAKHWMSKMLLPHESDDPEPTTPRLNLALFLSSTTPSLSLLVILTFIWKFRTLLHTKHTE